MLRTEDGTHHQLHHLQPVRGLELVGAAATTTLVASAASIQRCLPSAQRLAAVLLEETQKAASGPPSTSSTIRRRSLATSRCLQPSVKQPVETQISILATRRLAFASRHGRPAGVFPSLACLLACAAAATVKLSRFRRLEDLRASPRRRPAGRRRARCTTSTCVHYLLRKTLQQQLVYRYRVDTSNRDSESIRVEITLDNPVDSEF
eukprot:COSAG02_NODE_9370_length_2239_cov_2.593670_2_plen_206_part_00